MTLSDDGRGIEVPAVRERMENAAQLRVPLVVDAGIGDNWDQAH